MSKGGNIHVHSFEPAQYIENNTDSRNQTIRKPGNRTEQTVKPRTALPKSSPFLALSLSLVCQGYEAMEKRQDMQAAVEAAAQLKEERVLGYLPGRLSLIHI